MSNKAICCTCTHQALMAVVTGDKVSCPVAGLTPREPYRTLASGRHEKSSAICGPGKVQGL